MSFDPITLALTGLQGAMSIADAKSQKEAASQQAAFAAQEAARQRSIAELNARRIADKNRAVRSKVFAQQAAGGTDPNTGSALLTQKNLAAEDSLEQEMARFEGELAAQGLEHKAAIAQNNASVLKGQAYFDTGTSLLSQFEGKSEFDFHTGEFKFS